MQELQVPEHKHPLKLIDLQLEYPPYEEEEEEEEEEEGGDQNTKGGFHGVTCNRCDLEIHMYHRYYYRCTVSCEFSLHKFCAELSIRLEHTSHRHPLIYQCMDDYWSCRICESHHKPIEKSYCCNECLFYIDAKCAVEVGKKILYHPSHPHPLMWAIPKPILYDCNACGKRHEGIFYHCTTCVGFTIHNDCAFQPKTLLIQQTTHKAFDHPHPLTISYSFPKKDQEAKHYPRCRVCGDSFSQMEDLWIYRCDKCLYYVHVYCATSRTEPFMSIFLRPRKNIKNFEYGGNPHLLHLPFPDETYSMPKHLFFQLTDPKCGVQVDKKAILHPCHQHLLLPCADSKPILSECRACGNEHEGIFYQCTTCVGFTIHHECAFLPRKLLIRNTIKCVFDHTHPLAISYAYKKDLLARNFKRCILCCKSISLRKNRWVYKCDKCRDYVHVACLTPKKWLLEGVYRIFKEYKDLDSRGLLQYPFPGETYDRMRKYLFFTKTIDEVVKRQQMEYPFPVNEAYDSMKKYLFFGFKTMDEVVRLQHISHEHPLILVDAQRDGKTYPGINNSSLLLMCHNPMRKTQLLCNGCLRPIMSTMPFYKCNQNCDFALHEWCTRLPQKIENHPGHPQHALRLMYSNELPFFFGVFDCEVCKLLCNGFAYCCVECEYYADVCCGFLPTEITHKVHPDHLLSIGRKGTHGTLCPMCHRDSTRGQLTYNCHTCGFYVHPECAFLLPEGIRHKHDKHQLYLSFLPIENHKSEYFCEICEEDLNPHRPFYHCRDCAQSVHTACAPLILQCETQTYIKYQGGIYVFMNIKFGGIHNNHSHRHPLSFAQGVVLDGQCNVCGEGLQYKMVFKCLACNIAIDYDCCKRLNDT